MSYFLAPKQPSTEKNGNQCAWQPVSIATHPLLQLHECWLDCSYAFSGTKESLLFVDFESRTGFILFLSFIPRYKTL
jgi:hypothetical protein